MSWITCETPILDNFDGELQVLYPNTDTDNFWVEQIQIMMTLCTPNSLIIILKGKNRVGGCDKQIYHNNKGSENRMVMADSGKQMWRKR